jgi:hypothetical protein
MDRTTTPTPSSYLTLEPYAPSPERSPQAYTAEKIHERLKFVERVKEERDITPRSEIFLQLYEDAAQNALAIADRNARLQYCIQLYRYDRFIQENTFLSKKRSGEQKELEEKLLKLKKLEYYVRYGDYLARDCAALRDAAAALKSNELQQYWTTVNLKMKQERLIFNRDGDKTKPGDIPTLFLIWAAANAVKLPTDRAEWAIEEYAERNALVHSSVTELIQAGHWSRLARLLYHDAKDLPLMIPPGEEDDIENMSALIENFRTKYFIIDVGDEEDPETWRANEEATQYRAALRLKTDEKDRKKAEVVEAAAKRAKAAANKREQDNHLIEKATARKRKASQPFPLGEAILSKKTKEMEKVVGIQNEVDDQEAKLGKLYKKRDEAIDALGNLDIEDDAAELENKD